MTQTITGSGPAPSPEGGGAPGGARRVVDRIVRGSEGWTGIAAVLLVIIIGLSVAQPEFLTSSNIWNVLRANAVLFVLVCGMTFVILARGIDLSIGPMLGLLTMFLGLTITHGWGGVVSVIGILVAGLGLGALNGLLIAKGRINFFVVTLGTSIIFGSAALLTTSGDTISLYGVDGFELANTLGNENVGPVPVSAIVAAVIALVSYGALRWTVFGRSVYAIGGNPEAARLAGIRVERITLYVYMISGFLVALAAVLYSGRIQSATPSVGSDLTLQVIAAVLLGGVSFAGGSGSIVGALAGALLLSVINNGLDISGVSSFWQGIVTGSILIIAVFLDRFRSVSA